MMSSNDIGNTVVECIVVIVLNVINDMFACKDDMTASSPESACASSGVLLFGVSWPLVRSTANIHMVRIRSTYTS